MYTLRGGADGRLRGPCNQKEYGSLDRPRAAVEWARAQAPRPGLPPGSDETLKPGFEGTARYVIGERLDNSGMRWIEGRAEAILLLRCIEVNGDWEDFMRWSQEQRHQELERGQIVQIRSKIPTQLPRVA